MPFLLRLIAAEERKRGADLSEKLIVIEPGDPEFSVGLNVLEAQAGQQSYVQLPSPFGNRHSSSMWFQRPRVPSPALTMGCPVAMS
jgi:hypothetical protein